MNYFLSNGSHNFWFHADLLNFTHLHSERITASSTFPKLSDGSSDDVVDDDDDDNDDDDDGDDENDDGDDDDDAGDCDGSDATCKNFIVS